MIQIKKCLFDIVVSVIHLAIYYKLGEKRLSKFHRAREMENFRSL